MNNKKKESMAKKKKSGNELPSINFKLPQELKQWITEQACDEDLTVSNFLRKEMIASMNGDRITVDREEYYEQSLIGSQRFLNLMIWMYTKRVENKCKINNARLGEYIDTLKEIRNIFPKDIEVEFEKVLLDTLKVRSKKSEYERVFKFGREYLSFRDHNTVNFEQIEHYLLVGRRNIIYV